jgi:hypothetical protein
MNINVNMSSNLNINKTDDNNSYIRSSSPPPKRPYHKHSLSPKSNHSEKDHTLTNSNINKNNNNEISDSSGQKVRSSYLNLFLIYSPILTNKADFHYEKSVFKTDGINHSIIIPIEFNLFTRDYYYTYLKLIKNHPGFTLYMFSPKTQRDWIREIFRDHENKYLRQIWEAYNSTNILYHKSNLFTYAWIYIHGGVSLKPWIITERSLISIKHTMEYIDFPELMSPNSNNNQLLIFFPTQKGYIDNNILFSTKKHPLIYQILKTVTNNILNNIKSNTLYRHVHMDFQAISGSIAITNEFYKHYHFPENRIPQSGFISPNIGIVPYHLKEELFKINIEYYKNKEILCALDIDINNF